MQLGGNRRRGVTTAFIDSATGEILLAVRTDHQGEHAVLFCLSDSTGAIVADSGGFAPYRTGLVIKCSTGQLLLQLPGDASGALQYCLYSRSGKLLTESDGVRTRLYGSFQMQSSIEAQGTGKSAAPASQP